MAGLGSIVSQKEIMYMELSNDELKRVFYWSQKTTAPLSIDDARLQARIRENIDLEETWVCENAECCRKVQIECTHREPHLHVDRCDVGCLKMPGVPGSKCRPINKVPVPKMICENGHICRADCNHKIPHDKNGNICSWPCDRYDGINGSVCRPYAELLT